MRKEAIILMLTLFWGGMSYAHHEESEHLRDSLAYVRAQSNFSATDTTHINLLNELAASLRYYKPDSTYLLAKEALELSRKVGYMKGESMALLRVGDYYSDQGQSDEAIDKFNEAFAIAEDLNDRRMILRVINNLAAEYGYKGDIERSLNGYLDGVERIQGYLEEDAGNKELLTFLSIMNENIANLFASQKYYEQSLEYFNEVRKINVKIGDPVIMAETSSNLASVYIDSGDFENAMFHANTSINTFEKEKIMDWLAYAYEIKGKIYLKQDNYKWALHWYKQSELIHKDIEDDRGIIDLYDGMAQVYLAQEKDSLAEKYALMAYEIADRIKFREGKQTCARTLYKIHEAKGDYNKAFEYLELYQELYEDIHKNENKKGLVLFQTEADYEKQKKDMIEANEKALAKRDRYVYVSIAVLLVFIVIIFLVHRNQKIQKHLNGVLNAKKELLEKREAELQANNETKTKLFSIIGHDLRGPIGALQGLLNMFSDGEISKKEFMEFLPKLRGDVDHIFFTLNNLLSWGHSQLNGSVTKPEVTALENIVVENINLLSEQAQNKSIRIVNELPDNTTTWADANQIDIVIRNLMSNALKFTPENGMIKISGQEFADHWQISVRDTGVGMDQATVDKLFDKDSNVTTYGTNNEKGTGLGLSLCKEMVEKNKGKIWVESTIRKGSTFHFTLPKIKHRYPKAS